MKTLVLAEFQQENIQNQNIENIFIVMQNPRDRVFSKDGLS